MTWHYESDFKHRLYFQDGNGPPHMIEGVRIVRLEIEMDDLNIPFSWYAMRRLCWGIGDWFTGDEWRRLLFLRYLLRTGRLQHG